MASSPTVDLCSAESSLSEDPSLDVKVFFQNKDVASKTEGCKAPVDADSRPKSCGSKKSGSVRPGGGTAGEEDAPESGGALHSSGRKKRARATPAEDVDSARKNTTEGGGRESSLWPGADGEGPVQGSLLEEVLAEKRMALMRSPQVLQFLQQQQSAIQAAQQVSLDFHQEHLYLDQVESDANS